MQPNISFSVLNFWKMSLPQKTHDIDPEYAKLYGDKHKIEKLSDWP